MRAPAPRLAGVDGPRLTTRYSDAPEHDPENPSQECLTHILTEGAVFMSELFSHGGKILQAVYPDTITIQIGEHVVEMRADTETQKINMKAIQ